MTTTHAGINHRDGERLAERSAKGRAANGTVYTVAYNKAIARRFLECVSAHDVDGILGLITPTWTMTGGPPGLPPGEAGIRALFATFGRIEQHWAIADVVAEDEVVVVRGTCTVEQDQFLGIYARGRKQVFTATFTHHVVDGLIERTHRNADDLGRLLQLGATFQPSTA